MAVARPSGPFTLHGRRVDPAANEIIHDGTVVRLEPKTMAVLVALAERPGEAVRRDDLLRDVWPDVVVTDASLTRCVSQLRQALGDESRAPEIIETIPTVGYRLLVAPEAGSYEAPNPKAPPKPADHRRLSPWLRLAIPAAVLSLAVLVVWLAVSLRQPESATVEYRIDVTGRLVEPIVNVTLPGGENSTVQPERIPYVAEIPLSAAEHGLVEVRITGRAEDATVRLSMVARRGDEIVSRSQSMGQVDGGPMQRIDVSANVNLDE